MSHSLKEISSSGIHFVWCDVQQNKIKRRLDRSQTLTLSGAMCNKTGSANCYRVEGYLRDSRIDGSCDGFDGTLDAMLHMEGKSSHKIYQKKRQNSTINQVQEECRENW
jgi:hypothetical protein